MSDRAVASPRVVSIADLRRLARRRLPRLVFDYVDGGAEGEVTLRANRRAFDAVTFRPRQAVGLVAGKLATTVLGAPVALPVLLAPVGYSRLMHPDGERAAARAAGAAGTIYILSTMSGHALEDVKAASAGAVWYQLYLIGGRDAGVAAMARARAAGYTALVVTIDTPVAGLRERDVRNGVAQLLGGSLRSKLPFLPQLLARPRWLASFLMDGGVPALPNVVPPGRPAMPLVDVTTALSRAAVAWSDLRWLRDAWGGGPIVVKGVLTADDARRAVDAGAAAVVVSNHGGRQLDGAPASLAVLPEVVAAVGGQVEVLMDGGVRRGSDVVKALCHGARAVLVGRAYAYGLAAAGAAGVSRALAILGGDMERTLKLLGCGSVSELDRSFVDVTSR